MNERSENDNFWKTEEIEKRRAQKGGEDRHESGGEERHVMGGNGYGIETRRKALERRRRHALKRIGM